MTGLVYPLGDAVPAPGEAAAVADGVLWVRMPLPSALDHVNVWLLDDGEGWTIVDCGIAAPELQTLWKAVFAERLCGRPVRRIIVTHMHSDHFGLAAWLSSVWRAPVFIAPEELAQARRLLSDDSQRGNEFVAHYRRHGATDRDFLEHARRHPSPYPQLVGGIPDSVRPLIDDQAIAIGGRTWRALEGRGHSPAHMALACPELRVVIAGDLLLPKISPFVGVTPLTTAADPLGDYLGSLDRFARLPDDFLVLPSHGRPFRPASLRVDELRRLHESRLRAVANACRSPTSAADLIPVVFGERIVDHRNYAFAFAEVLAHLHSLVASHRVRETMDGAGTVVFWVTAGRLP